MRRIDQEMTVWMIIQHFGLGFPDSESWEMTEGT
jgi:hypothetical protein